MASNSSNFTAGNTAESDMLAEFEERFNSLFADHMKPIDDAFYDLMIGLSNPTTNEQDIHSATEGGKLLSVPV